MREVCLGWQGWDCRQLSSGGGSVLRLDGNPPETSFPACPAPGQAEAVFCCRGGLHLTLSSSRKLELRPGQVLFLPAGIGHCQGRFCRENFQGVLISEPEENIRSALKSLCPGLPSAMPAFLHGCRVVHAALWNQSMFQVLEQLPECLQGEYCRLKMLELLYLLHAGIHSRQPAEDDYYDPYQVQVVEKIHDYLAEHLEERLTIPRLAEAFNISGTMLKSCFRQMYGKPLHRYLLERRMERAAELLSGTDQPVIEIAALAGYSSTSQFGIMFKAYYQMTPAQYRKAVKMSVSVGSCPNPMEKPGPDPL